MLQSIYKNRVWNKVSEEKDMKSNRETVEVVVNVWTFQINTADSRF